MIFQIALLLPTRNYQNSSLQLGARAQQSWFVFFGELIH